MSATKHTRARLGILELYPRYGSTAQTGQTKNERSAYAGRPVKKRPNGPIAQSITGLGPK